MLQRGHSGDGFDLAPTSFTYGLRKGDLFVLSWARGQRVRRGCVFRAAHVRSIFLLPLVVRCLEKS